MSSEDNGAQQRKKRLAIMGVSSVLLVAMVAAVAVGNGNSGNDSNGGTEISTSQRNVDTLCLSAEYKETCKKSVESVASGNNTDMKTLIKAAFNSTAVEITNQMTNSSLYKELEKDPSTKDALDVCNEVFGYALKSINDSIDKVDKFELSNLGDFAYDLKVWLSGAITMQHTCLDGFQNSTTEAGQTMAGALKTALEMSNNALDIVEGFSSVLEDINLDGSSGDDVESTADAKNKSRKLLTTADDIPTWVDGHQRRLLQLQLGTNNTALKPDAVVSQDGTGQFTTLTDALKTVPPTNNKPFVIYVKAGIYNEEVTVAANTMNFVTIVGDGATKTKFTAGKSQKDGVTTYHTSTFSVNGNNFMAMDVAFENTAGASAGPAVALRVTGDKAVVYRCNVEGFQDTLYPSAYRQFYRDCIVWGTIDFIFGDAVTVFQNCTIMMRRGVDGQEAVVAAGGKNQQAGPSALVFQGCRFLPDPSYMDTAAVKNGMQISYLARPWKPYAKTVIIESYIHEIFNLKGYIPFTGSNFENTCTALEYGNVGPGGVVAERVKWPGVNPNLPQSEAAQYYPGKYFELSDSNEGDAWIVSSGVPYSSGPMLAPSP